MAAINKALADLESREPGEPFLLWQELQPTTVLSAVTLARRHQGISAQPKKVKNQQQSKLTPHEEAELVQYIERLSERHLPPTRNMVQNFASHIAKEDVSESWVTRFINRHSSKAYLTMGDGNGSGSPRS